MPHLRLMGERLRGEERERRRGDKGDRLLKGERLILRREVDLGLVSLDRSRPLSKSGRGRFLWKDTRVNGESHMRTLLLLLDNHLGIAASRKKADKPLWGVRPVKLPSPDIRRAAPPSSGRSPGSGWGVAALGQPVRGTGGGMVGVPEAR